MIAELLVLMAAQHGVASSVQARAAGIGPRAENVLVRRGVLGRPAAGLLMSPAAPRTWHQRAMAAVLAPGCTAISHGAAARLHRLDGFDSHDVVDVLCRKGCWPHPPAGTITHFTRGLTNESDLTTIDALPVLTVPATLALLSATAGRSATRRALTSAVLLGQQPGELREVATRWRRRGRPGPATLLELLDELDA